MEVHEDFRRWATDQGLEINGIRAHKFEGRGLGIIAEKDIEAGSTILKVPLKALHQASSVPKSLRLSLPNITVHGLLAANLTLNTSAIHSTWLAVLPRYSDFMSMPLLWDSQLKEHLPQPAQELLRAQQAKLDANWAIVSTAFPDTTYEKYLYNWLIVNTRTFYFVSPTLSEAAKAKIPRDCRMALNPFSDYFNHSSAGCEVTFSSAGCQVVSVQPIKKGEEVYISYGSHSNDFLLVEYGFILEENKWDQVSLDGFILPMLNSKQKEDLKDAGFLGNYVVDQHEVCYRTQVALRSLCIPPGRWRRFMGGLDTGERDQAIVDEMLLHVLALFGCHVSNALAGLTKLPSGPTTQLDVLAGRWRQIELLLINAIDRLQS